MELSLPGLIGAVIGLVVGVIDYGLIAMLIRRAVDKMSGGSTPVARPSPERVDLILKGVFVVNCLVFAGLGYWLGATIGG